MNGEEKRSEDEPSSSPRFRDPEEEATKWTKKDMGVRAQS